MAGGRQIRGKRYKSKRLIKSRYSNIGYYLMFVFLIAVALFGGIFFILRTGDSGREQPDNTGSISVEQGSSGGHVPLAGKTAVQSDPDAPDDANESDIDRATPFIPIPIPNPYAVDSTRPEQFGLRTTMQLNGQIIESYSRANPIDFGDSNHYTDMEGILTFRGNNFRDNAAYGSLGSSIEGNLDIVWQTRIPEVFQHPTTDALWFGLGWTGQPLVVKWGPETIANMNIFESKRNKPDLKEVIFGTMGTSIYFLDLDDGRPTREKVDERWIFKGAGALDPRGYPLFYVGSGDVSTVSHGRNLIYSLTNTSALFGYGENDGFRDRGWMAFDGSTIVHAPTDTVTYPSESNVIYQFTLNSYYDPSTGTMTIAPSDMFKWKYSTTRLREVYGGGYGVASTLVPQYGFESSAVFWREYMYITSNCGFLFCINVNTFEVIWMSETYDDTDATPVLELDHANGRAYIYVGNSAYFSRDPETNIAHTSFFKIDAVTGEKVWTSVGHPCLRRTESGGIKATAALGRNDLSDLVFVPYANVANDRGLSRGTFLTAYDKETGAEVWSGNFGGQCWSSPIAVYDDNGKGYIIFATAAFTNSDGQRVGGFIHLLDGRTGERLSSIDLGGHIEASPVVYDNMIVIGTRSQVVYGIRIS